MMWDEARKAYEAGDLSNAKLLLEQVIESEPSNVEALHLMCVLAYRKGELRLHEQFLERLLSVQPNHVRSLTALANLFLGRGQLQEAIELADRAIQIAPQYGNAYNTLGLCYNELGNWKRAADCFNKAIERQPNASLIHVNLGLAQQRLGQRQMAVESYRAAINLAPENPEAYEGLGRLYAQENKRAQALSFYKRALRLRPNSVRYLLLVAEVLQHDGFIDEALKLVTRALELDPASAEAQLSCGYLKQDTGEFEAAKAAFQRSIELQPHQGRAYLGLISSTKTGEGDRTLVASIHRLIESQAIKDADRALLHLALGKAYGDFDEYEKTVRHLDEANRIFIERNGGSSPFSRSEFEKFIDRLIETFTPQLFAERTDFGFKDDLPLAIIGLPRSGTTLIEQILSCHPQISPAGEQPFWADLDAEESVTELANKKDRCHEIGEAYLRLLRRIGPNSRHVTDKRPDNFCFAGFIHLIFPKARFIHCRRGPLDNAISLYLTPFRVHAPFTYSREDIVFYMEQYQRLMGHWRRVIPPELILDVDYEDVVTGPEATARRILDFCELQWDDACLHPEQNNRIVNTPSNWQTRQAIYKTSIGKWRHYEQWLGALGSLRSGE